MGASPPPTLRPVPPPEERAEPGAPEAQQSGGFRWGRGLVIALLVLLGLGLVWQVLEGRRMAAQIEVLQGNLAETREDLLHTRSELTAHRQERTQVRQRLGAVRGQIEALEGLLAKPPAASSTQ